jgi:hypothetical protein
MKVYGAGENINDSLRLGLYDRDGDGDGLCTIIVFKSR